MLDTNEKECLDKYYSATHFPYFTTSNILHNSKHPAPESCALVSRFLPGSPVNSFLHTLLHNSKHPILKQM
uniref:Uncharacterized protein n=1 Tax=Arundo donax TaxID=35708 RepID=A0A0A9FVJ9_ARUDO